MNENIMAMVAELELSFPIKWEQHDKIKDLHFEIYDDRGYKFGVDKKFDEKRFDYMRISYKDSAIGINRKDLTHNYFNVETDSLIEPEDFVELTKIINIVVKHLSKIDFKAHL